MKKPISFRQRLSLLVHAAVGRNNRETFIAPSVVDRNAIIKRKAQEYARMNPTQGRALFLLG